MAVNWRSWSNQCFTNASGVRTSFDCEVEGNSGSRMGGVLGTFPTVFWSSKPKERIRRKNEFKQLAQGYKRTSKVTGEHVKKMSICQTDKAYFNRFKAYRAWLEFVIVYYWGTPFWHRNLKGVNYLSLILFLWYVRIKLASIWLQCNWIRLIC